MLMFTLAISCLTTSNLPWFMDLTLQVPMQYCSLQHQTLLLSPVTSTTGCCFCFGSNSLFFLELFLHWSPIASWMTSDLGSDLSVSYLFAFSFFFCLFPLQKVPCMHCYTEFSQPCSNICAGKNLKRFNRDQLLGKGTETRTKISEVTFLWGDMAFQFNHTEIAWTSKNFSSEWRVSTT